MATVGGQGRTITDGTTFNDRPFRVPLAGSGVQLKPHAGKLKLTDASASRLRSASSHDTLSVSSMALAGAVRLSAPARWVPCAMRNAGQ